MGRRKKGLYGMHGNEREETIRYGEEGEEIKRYGEEGWSSVQCKPIMHCTCT